MRFKHEGVCRDGNGVTIVGATVSVYLSGGSTAASVYTALAGGSAVNSVTSDSTDGSFIFYVDEADYAANQKFKTITTHANYRSKTSDDIVIYPNWRSAFSTFADGDTTPSVIDGDNFKTANTTATTITDLDDGYDGQEINIVFGDTNTTIDFTGTNLKGNIGVNWSPTTNDSMNCVYDGTTWYCAISDNSA